MNDRLRALIFEFPSNVPVTASYSEIEKFYGDINHIIRKKINGAPKGLRSGWFTSDIELYALQKALYEGTMHSFIYSLIIALILLMVTSLNFIISIFSTITIGCIIMVTTAFLVLLGWQLNVLESITASIAVGLSVDFTAHYAIAYLIAPGKSDRQQRVEHATTRLGSAITLAAITTMVASAGLMPSTVLAYRRFGVFLMTVMAVSLIYSTYLFLALLSAFGPQNNCCGVSCQSCCCCTSQSPEVEEHTTLMTETSSLKAIGSPTCSHHLPGSNSGYADQRCIGNIEIIERSTVI